jgi:ATP synthase protein I
MVRALLRVGFASHSPPDTPLAEYPGTSDPPPLDDLSSRLDAARKDAALEQVSDSQHRGRAMGTGFRLGSELLAAMIVGPLLGLGLDRLAGTSPWGLVGGVFLGFAAGVLNVSRAMKATAAKDEAETKN